MSSFFLEKLNTRNPIKSNCDSVMSADKSETNAVCK